MKHKPSKKTGGRTRSQTRGFGSSRRENHNAEHFYRSRLYADQSQRERNTFHENPLPPECENQLFCQSSESMAQLPDASVHLVITSPPYNASKQYDLDLSLTEYQAFLGRVFREVDRVLVPGGRVCINIANLGRSPYIPLHCYVIEELLAIGFLMRGEIIWDKGSSAGISTAWGSWNSPTNPTLRDTHEYILVFSKASFIRPKPDHPATMHKEEFMSYTRSIWQFRSESARKIGHPAPFPEELPYRLIQLYSFEQDVVLDPFCGSGTTCVVAKKTDRRYVGFDSHLEYIDLARHRLEQVDLTESY